MKYTLTLFVFIIICACKQKQDSNNIAQKVIEIEKSKSEDEQVQDLEVYDYNGFEKFLNKNDDKVYVINFWATWCAPCVKELPHFEALNAKYSKKNVEFILVSLDFPHLYESKLKPFIKDKKLKSKVIALDDVDMNTWIPKVDKTWSGSLPATIIYKNDNKKFFEQSFTYDELETELKQFLN